MEWSKAEPPQLYMYNKCCRYWRVVGARAAAAAARAAAAAAAARIATARVTRALAIKGEEHIICDVPREKVACIGKSLETFHVLVFIIHAYAHCHCTNCPK